jgi:Zn-finger nucleic acid-binding protein
MKGSENESKKQGVRVELKYCEHCGGLWLRECGSGVIYCDNCQPKVADLPVPKKKPQRVVLPVRQRTVIEDYEVARNHPGDTDLDAAGGAA